MPQIVNDESIIPALESTGIGHRRFMDYVLVGCVELSTQGNYLGWSDAAMFNLVKVLELTLNDGKCMITGKQTGLKQDRWEIILIMIRLKLAFRNRLIFLQVK